MSWFDDGGSGSSVDVAALMDSAVIDHIAGIIAAGALVSMGTTSDGGALGITVTLDGRWKRTYVRHTEEAVDWLTAARQAVELEADRPTASSAPRPRKRRSG